MDALTLYVSPAGNDDWSGLLPEPNAAGTDGPFATPERARLAARGAAGPVTVMLRAGHYFLDQPLTFTPEDSGTADAPVVWRNFPGELPVLSAGLPVTGWEAAEVHGHPAWVAPAPAGFFRRLYVNGASRTRSRLPREGFFRIQDVPGATAEDEYSVIRTAFLARPEDVAGWSRPTEVEVIAMQLWAESRLPVASVDDATGLVTTALGSIFNLRDDWNKEAFCRFYAENVWEALQPGDWYLDRAAGKLYYLPLPGETPTSVQVIAPRHDFVVLLQGDVATGRFVEHLHFRGLTFAHNEWRKPPDQPWWGRKEPQVCGDSQAAISVPGALRAVGAHYCRWERCTVTSVGSYGLELGRGCRDNLVSACELTDLAAGGVRLGTTAVADAWCTGDNTVVDCHIHDGGKLYHSAIGLWVGHSGDNLVSHNHIHDFYYSGISAGWTWGYKPSGSLRNTFEWNHVHDLGKGWLSDMGGIYTLGISTGTVIRCNIFHHVTCYDYGGWGLYHDEGSTGILSENNLVYACKSQSFHQHYGCGNVLRNNLFALATQQQIARSREEEHVSFVLEHNVIYWREADLLWGNWTNGLFQFANNLYWDASGQPPKFGELTWEEWRATGQDAGSMVADPGFADPAAFDFTLPPDSPALQVGFVPFDLSAAGPRGPVGAGPDA